MTRHVNPSVLLVSLEFGTGVHLLLVSVLTGIVLVKHTRPVTRNRRLKCPPLWRQIFLGITRVFVSMITSPTLSWGRQTEVSGTGTAIGNTNRNPPTYESLRPTSQWIYLYTDDGTRSRVIGGTKGLLLWSLNSIRNGTRVQWSKYPYNLNPPFHPLQFLLSCVVCVRRNRNGCE